jgi:hypothetical protein
MTTAANLQSVYSAAVPVQDKELAEGRRRSKRQVLEARNVDVDQVIEATDAITRGDDLNAAGLSESFSAVRDSFDALKERAEGAAAAGETAPGPGQEDMGLGAEPEQGLPTTGAGTTTMNKFQMQMSGEWNNRVLADSPSDASFGPGDNFYVDGGDYDEDDLTSSFLQKWERASTPPVVENVPQNISMAPLSLDLRTTSNSAAALMLQELDKDYLSLRQRLVDILQTVETQPQTQPPPSLEAPTPVAQKLKYWPPLARLKKNKV